MPRVLTTDANQRVALSIARALGEASFFVGAAEKERVKAPLSWASRFVGDQIALSDPYFESLLKECDSYDVLLPMSTNTILGVLERGEDFAEKIATLLPDRQTFLQVNNKADLYRIASDVGIPMPRTFVVEQRSDLEEAGKKLGFPLVLKLQDDIGLYLDPGARYAIVRRKSKLHETYEALSARKPGVVAQEYVSGAGLGVSALIAPNGEEKAVFSHKRLREYPISGGPSTVCVSIRDESLIDRVLQLLKSVDWQGVAMVEFKRNPENGEVYLLEVNPRFWGSLPLAVSCGVNFPALCARIALGEDVPPVLKYSVGKKMRFLATDTLAFIEALAKGNFNKIAQYFRYLFDPSVKPGIFRFSDPIPALRYLLRR